MFDRETIGLIGFAILFVLLILRVPVGLAMIMVGVGGNFALSIIAPYLRFEPYLAQFKTLLWGTVANYSLSVVPLFILMGFLASHSRLSRDLFQGFNALVGHFRGGVAMAAIGACAGFGAVCGSSLATASTMGKVALPELDRLRYAPKLATGTLAAGGTLGILIPPSVALVIYAIIVEASIIQMFQAAIIPGLLAVAFFIAVIALLVRLKPELAPETAVMTASEKRQAYLRLIPVVVIFGAIILGLGVGLFTPTPAAAIGATAILLYGLFLRFLNPEAGLSASGIKSSVLDTAVTSGMIYFILFGAEVLKGFFARAGLPAAMATWASESGVDPWILLILLLLMLIVLGCFMDSLAMILVVVPFFWPALVEINGGDYATAATAAYGLGLEDLKIWFGIVALVVVELGLITPPVGLNVFIISAMSRGIRMGEVFAGVMPFFGIEIIRIALLLLLPGLCLFLPHLLAG
ncbi:TRAP transporter large permease [Nisaea acidiphila]|uniref:TRAP transporter large permease n=1 Tax=Nisaea acidiphila TaxID=1862145 RepID=A0A9J7ANF7_9PROT|nr:TRAP transporter large permease [Nisaea acidiphila]UUX48474.1 TRAP transporter large permease [Nisaea acidiphila]